MLGATYQAECGTAGTLWVNGSQKQEFGAYLDKYVIDGTLGGRTLNLEFDPPSLDGPENATYVGTLDGAPVTLLVARNGDAFNVVSASRIGGGDLICQGPASTINDDANTPDTYLLWDNPSTVAGTFGGDSRTSRAEAAVLCNLVTVGVPASGINFLGP